MTTDPRWTDDTEETVARRIGAVHRHRIEDIDLCWRSYSEQARTALAWLADNGLLIPPGGHDEQKWDVKWLDIETGQFMVTSTYGDRRDAELRLHDLSQVWGQHARLRSRRVITTPWVEVTEGAER